MRVASFDPISRLRRGTAARGLPLLAIALLAFTGCAALEAQKTRGGDPEQLARLPTADRSEVGQQWAVPGDARFVHLVRAGETLSGIAARYRVRVSAICALNRILDPDRIEAGRRLRLPQGAVLSSRPPSPSMHPPRPLRAQALLIEAEEQYLDARFERALESSQQAEALLEGESESNELRAWAAFVAGSALVGLGEEQRAKQQFARVRVLDPRFEPPAGWLSPRLGTLYGSASAR